MNYTKFMVHPSYVVYSVTLAHKNWPYEKVNVTGCLQSQDRPSQMHVHRKLRPAFSHRVQYSILTNSILYRLFITIQCGSLAIQNLLMWDCFLLIITLQWHINWDGRCAVCSVNFTDSGYNRRRREIARQNNSCWCVLVRFHIRRRHFRLAFLFSRLEGRSAHLRFQGDRKEPLVSRTASLPHVNNVYNIEYSSNTFTHPFPPAIYHNGVYCTLIQA